MPKDTTAGQPTTRRYSPDEKAAAVQMVRTLRAELGTDHGTVKRVATQLGYGTESVRSWVRQADIDQGHVAGVSTSESSGWSFPRPMGRNTAHLGWSTMNCLVASW